MSAADRGPLVDSVAAAVAAKVAPSTIRSWAKRGKLTRQGQDDKGRALYALADVYAVLSSKIQGRAHDLQ